MGGRGPRAESLNGRPQQAHCSWRRFRGGGASPATKAAGTGSGRKLSSLTARSAWCLDRGPEAGVWGQPPAVPGFHRRSLPLSFCRSPRPPRRRERRERDRRRARGTLSAEGVQQQQQEPEAIPPSLARRVHIQQRRPSSSSSSPEKAPGGRPPGGRGEGEAGRPEGRAAEPGTESARQPASQRGPHPPAWGPSGGPLPPRRVQGTEARAAEGSFPDGNRANGPRPRSSGGPFRRRRARVDGRRPPAGRRVRAVHGLRAVRGPPGEPDRGAPPAPGHRRGRRGRRAGGLERVLARPGRAGVRGVARRRRPRAARPLRRGVWRTSAQAGGGGAPRRARRRHRVPARGA